MKKYQTPEIDLLVIAVKDILVASPSEDNDDNFLFPDNFGSN